MKDVKKNFIYNLIYQFFVLIFPIVLIPYTSRVLKAESIGIYSYTYSIVGYFLMVSMLGINIYGSRKIAKNKDNKKKLSKNFSEIYIIQIITTFLMLILYYLYILVFVKTNVKIAIIQSLFLFASFFDIAWFFSGMENFKVNIFRNVVFKFITFLLIIFLVKKPSDVVIYTIIMSLSTVICNLFWFKYLKKEIVITKIKMKDVLSHIKPCIILFLPIIAKSIYQSMDKVMLGAMISMVEVGIYEQAAKLIKIPMCLVDALSTVMIPRNSNLASKKDDKTIISNMEKSIYFSMFAIIPICFGLFAISDDLIPLALGHEFAKSAANLKILLASTLVISFALIIKTQYLVPKEKDNNYIIPMTIGAIINLVLNYILIPKYYSIGASIGTLITEIFIMMYQVISVRKELPIKKFLKNIVGIVIKSLIMLACVMLIKLFNFSSIITICIQIFIGVTIYSLLNLKYILSLFKKKAKI